MPKYNVLLDIELEIEADDEGQASRLASKEAWTWLKGLVSIGVNDAVKIDDKVEEDIFGRGECSECNGECECCQK